MKSFNFPSARKALAALEAEALAVAQQRDVLYGKPALTGVEADETIAAEAKKERPSQKTPNKQKTGSQKN